MSQMSEVSMLRYVDDYGCSFIAACCPAGAADMLRFEGVTGEEVPSPPSTGVTLDCSGMLHVTDPDDLRNLAAWLGAASQWLEAAIAAEGD